MAMETSVTSEKLIRNSVPCTQQNCHRNKYTIMDFYRVGAEIVMEKRECDGWVGWIETERETEREKEKNQERRTEQAAIQLCKIFMLKHVTHAVIYLFLFY